MTKEEYDKETQIYDRIEELEQIQNKFNKFNYKLWYIFEKFKGSYGIGSQVTLFGISELVEKHDKMIRAEIEEEIEKLKKKIETL